MFAFSTLLNVFTKSLHCILWNTAGKSDNGFSKTFLSKARHFFINKNTSKYAV